MKGRGLPGSFFVIGVLAIAGIAWSSPDVLGFAGAWIGFLVVGLLVVRRQPEHRLGWLMLVTGSLSTIVVWALTATSFASTSPATVESVVRALTVWPWLSICAIVTLFPEGRAGSTFDRVLIRVIVWGGCVLCTLILLTPAALDSGRDNPLGWQALDELGPIAQGLGFLLIPLILLVALGSIVRKWLSSSDPVHGQYACLLIGAGATAAGFVLAFVTDGTLLGSVAWSGSLLALPVSMGVAILRFRLYGLDRIISRTTSYLIVTGLVLGVYAAVVTTTTRLLPSSSNVAVAAATLTAAAIVRPAVRRIQLAVDRRFDRTRYDARRTVDGFGSAMRTAVEPDEVADRLLSTVHLGLQPRSMSLWQRELP